MSHQTHHAHTDKTPKTSSTAALWFGLMLAALFIAALNFVKVMSQDDGDGHGAIHEPKIQTGSGTLENETGLGAPAHEATHTGNSAEHATHSEGH